MDQSLWVAMLVGGAATLYATAGQAGGTAFLAIMAFAAFSPEELRPTALLLNVVAAGYATIRLHRGGSVPWQLLWIVTLPSVGAAFLGGLLVLEGSIYFKVTGLLLTASAVLTMTRRIPGRCPSSGVPALPALLLGGAIGFASGLTGIGGGVFLAPALIAFGWATARQAAKISPPFILCNSAVALAGVLIAGQPLAPGTTLYAACAIGGAVLGTMIGMRWMSERATRFVLGLILLFAGVRLLVR